MTENMQKLLEAAAGSEELAEAIRGTQTPEALLALAEKAGLALTEEDLVLESADAELSDDELDNVAGGMSLNDLQMNAVFQFNGILQTESFFQCLGSLLGTQKSTGAKADSLVYHDKGGQQQARSLVYHGERAQARDLVHHEGSGPDLVSL